MRRRCAVICTSERGARVDFSEEAREVVRRLAQQGVAIERCVRGNWRRLAEVPWSEGRIADIGGTRALCRWRCEEMRGDRLHVRAAVTGGMEIQCETAEVDHERL